MTGTTTKRVDKGTLTDGSTKRVITAGAISAGIGNDTWHGAWGGFQATLQPSNSWGQTWFFGSTATTTQPSENSTKRVATGAITENSTKRVPETPMTTVS